MDKKGLFGGTFDPIHFGHLKIACEAINSLKLDKVVFLPNGNPPHKSNTNVTDGRIRLKMLESAIKDIPNFEVNDYEIRNPGVHYTYNTLELFNEMERNTKWYFITGADCLMELGTWKNVDIIMEKCQFVVFNRGFYSKEDILKEKEKVEAKYKSEIIFLDIQPIDISSTLIRNKILHGDDLEKLIPKETLEIINKFDLYR